MRYTFRTKEGAMEIKFKVKFYPDDPKLKERFDTILDMISVREELEWELANVIDTWMFPDNYRARTEVEYIE